MQIFHITLPKVQMYILRREMFTLCVTYEWDLLRWLEFQVVFFRNTGIKTRILTLKTPS